MPLQSSTEYILNFIDCKDISKIEEVRNFALLWNMFEDQIFGNSMNKTKIDEMNDKISKAISEIVVEKTFQFFSDRYTNENDGRSKFDGLKLDKKNFCSRDEIEDIYGKLKLKDCDKKEKTRIILYILYRLRNNLFHGEKEAREFYSQNEMFKVCNDFIIECLETYDKYTP